MVERIKTERLYLRSPRDSDALEMMEIYNSDFVMKYNCMNKKDLEGIKDSINKDKETETWYIEEIETGKFLGAIYCNNDSLRYKTGTKELSFWLGENRSGKGYLYEALKEITIYLFNTQKLMGITARTFSVNTRCRKLLEKLGFVQEGLLKNAVKAYGDVIYDDAIYYLESPGYKL